LDYNILLLLLLLLFTRPLSVHSFQKLVPPTDLHVHNICTVGTVLRSYSGECFVICSKWTRKVLKFSSLKVVNTYYDVLLVWFFITAYNIIYKRVLVVVVYLGIIRPNVFDRSPFAVIPSVRKCIFQLSISENMKIKRNSMESVFFILYTFEFWN